MTNRVAHSSRVKNYVSGLASGYVVTFATIAVGLWLTPFTLRFLDREQFAVFTLASDVLMWLGLLEIGLTSVLNVRAAQQTGKPDQQFLNTIASTTFFAQSGIALLFLLVGSLITFAFPDFFYLSAGLHKTAMLMMALMVLGAALTVGTQTFSALLIAHQQIHVDNMIRLLLIGIRTVLTLVLLISGMGLLSLAIAQLVAVVFTAVLAVWRVRKVLPDLSISRHHFSSKILLDTAGTGIWFSLGGAAGIMIMNLDRIITAKLVSVEMVTTLSLTSRLYTLAWTIVQQITNTARPALAQIIGEGKMHLALTKYHQLVRISNGLAILLAASLWAGNGNFVIWWVGAQNYGGAGLDALLALNLIVHSWVLPNRAILVAGMAYIPQNAVSRFVEGAVNFALSITLGLLMGLNGIIMSTAITGLATTCWYFPCLTARYFGIRPGDILRSDLARLAGFAFSLVIVAFFARLLSSQLRGLSGAAIGSGASMAIGTIIFWLLILDSRLRTQLLSKIPGKLEI